MDSSPDSSLPQDDRPSESVFAGYEPMVVGEAPAEVLHSLKRQNAISVKRPASFYGQLSDGSDESNGSPVQVDVLQFLKNRGVPLNDQVYILRAAASYIVATGKTSYKRPGPKKGRTQ